MLGEAATTEIARKQDAQRFDENKVAARKGGTIAGDAREKLEIETGNKVVSPENYLTGGMDGEWTGRCSVIQFW